MSAELNETQLLVLRTLCDTFVPSIKVADDPTGFWARTASDLGVDKVLARYLVESVPPELRGGLLGLLDGLAAQGFVGASQEKRESILSRISGSSPEAAKGVAFYQKQITPAPSEFRMMSPMCECRQSFPRETSKRWTQMCASSAQAPAAR